MTLECQQNEIFRMAKQMVKERQDITVLNCINAASWKVIVDDKGIKDCWKEYMEKLLNERMNGTIRYRLRLRMDQQIASGWPE